MMGETSLCLINYARIVHPNQQGPRLAIFTFGQFPFAGEASVEVLLILGVISRRPAFDGEQCALLLDRRGEGQARKGAESRGQNLSLWGISLGFGIGQCPARATVEFFRFHFIPLSAPPSLRRGQLLRNS